MPSTIVHAGFALLVAAALLRDLDDRRVLGLLLVVLAVPEADTVAGLWIEGAHRALLHTLLLPAAVAAALFYDTRVRERSRLRERVADRGVRVAWTLLFVHVFAHVLLDYAHLEGINALYPLYDRFVRLSGELYLSTTDGLVQTFVEVRTDPGGGGTAVDPGTVGTTADTHVANPVEPTAEPEPDEPVDRRFPIAVGGWQLYVILTGLFVLAARRLQGSGIERSGDGQRGR